MDDWFKTVDAKAQSSIDFDNDDWYKTFGLTEWPYVPDDLDDSPVAVETSVDNKQAHQREQLCVTCDAQVHPQRQLDPAGPPNPAY